MISMNNDLRRISIRGSMLTDPEKYYYFWMGEDALAVPGTLDYRDLRDTIAIDHNHDSAYAAIDHNHDSAYAAIDHNHDSAYAAIDHIHTEYVLIKDMKSSGTDGGSFASGAWRVRDLNTLEHDETGVVQLAANQITLPAGTYRVHGSCPAYRVGQHQARLYDYSNSAELLIGTSEYLKDDSSTTQSRSFLTGIITLAATTVIEFQHRCTVTKSTNGMGTATTFGNCVFSMLELWRLLYYD